MAFSSRTVTRSPASRSFVFEPKKETAAATAAMGPRMAPAACAKPTRPLVAMLSDWPI